MKKFSLYIIIAVLIIIVIGLLIFVYSIYATEGDYSVIFSSSNNREKLANPVITLDKVINDSDSSKVTIIAYATAEDEEIEKIILPDGNVINSNKANYEVEQNGIYQFQVVCKNGQTEIAEIEVTEIEKSSADNPYIPEGFSQIGGDVENGFVIEDSFGNQFVWVPVESGKLIRANSSNSEYKEIDDTTSAFVNSVAKFYGFYIARFEASIYEDNEKFAAASMAGKNPCTNISYLDAVEYINNSEEVFRYKDCNLAITNSYAWDTVLAWIDKTTKDFSSSKNYGNYSGTIYPTGYTESDNINNICDLSGNVREWTTEIFNEPKSSSQNIYQRVVRGGSANLRKDPISKIYYPENTSDNYWGFRTVLYK